MRGRSSRAVLAVDAAINLALGLLLLAFPFGVGASLGVPEPASRFYPTILGAVLFGIGIALVVESRRAGGGFVGLGAGGAIVINLCAVAVLFGWLVSGGLDIPLRGRIVLWAICSVVLVTAAVEIVIAGRGER